MKKKLVDMEVKFTGRRMIAHSILGDICKAVGEGMVSGSMQRNGHKISWCLTIEIDTLTKNKA